MMLPVPTLTMKRRSGTAPPSGATPGVLVWGVPFAFLVPMMGLVGVARLLAPWAKADLNLYFGRLAELLEESLAQAVAYRKAGAVAHAPSQPPRQPRAQARPTGAARPGGKPGARARSRQRQAR
jgi:hypothetical protein